jgi:hypothetical protein
MNGYPTEEELEHLTKLSASVPINALEIIEYIKQIWHMPEYGVVAKGNTLELHTGGWSGNEEIIGTLQRTLFWFLYWQKSERGGHYYFEGWK